MKIPKTIKRYCRFCKKHTEQKVTSSKRKPPSSLKKGSKVRARKRGQARGIGNKGKYSKPAISQFKRTGAKISKKTDLRLQCMKCKKTHVQRKSTRTKRLEIK